MKPVSSLSSPPTGAEGLVVFATGSEKAIFSFVPPSAGMFIWARFYLTNSPRFLKIQDSGKSVDPEQEFLDYVWAELSKALVGFNSIWTRFSFLLATANILVSGIINSGNIVLRNLPCGSLGILIIFRDLITPHGKEKIRHRRKPGDLSRGWDISALPSLCQRYLFHPLCHIEN